MRFGAASLLAVAAAVLLAGCASDGPTLPKISELNPFKTKQTPLPGRRIPIVETTESIGSNLAEANKPISLPSPRMNQSWSQPGGDANNAPGNLALTGSLHQLWSASAGEGSSKTGRVTASPIVFGDRIYTLDAAANVAAFTLTGSSVFTVSTKPETTVGLGGYGGGLAADNGRLYVANGYGVVSALDPGTGKAIWTKNLDVPVRAAPTAAGDRLYVITIDGRFYCLSGIDGSELWAARGLPQSASLMTSTSPAVDGDVVVVPYPSGDIMAFKLSDGSTVWTENLARTRQTSQIASMSDVARPAIDDGVVYAIGHAGRMVATQAKSGDRVWSLSIPGSEPPCVAGDTVYVVDTGGRLMALQKSDGKTRWLTQLPAAKNYAGPVLAANTLFLVSSTGEVVSVDPMTGKVGGTMQIGDKVYIPPIVAQGHMYVLTDSAKLIALN
ncbi:MULTISPECIES: PQQ-binding-like beta-propeller repeat protein [unclassified Hyphomicrobium]|uniref:outer membrane protein assembly factor BamB family protein n=1 Tax=unclassified Hyphomicrobium TaxID=2619925 RepID=UPI000213DFA7|nr:MULTISPECIES: PQQ-binding-like beta-propeller repeat protein [unclassified Hyphomicrobium]CCB66395.1 Pyrrolo-quinoline quinone [Hyphomicrobium sp. MC1]